MIGGEGIGPTQNFEAACAGLKKIFEDNLAGYSVHDPELKKRVAFNPEKIKDLDEKQQKDLVRHLAGSCLNPLIFYLNSGQDDKSPVAKEDVGRYLDHFNGLLEKQGIGFKVKLFSKSPNETLKIELEEI